MPNGTVEEQAKMYCASQFKMGTLVSYKDFEHAAKNLERTGLYDPEENGNWQHEVTSGLNISSIPCLNGGTLDPWIGDRCKCRENFTGMFCEIGHNSPSWSNTRINLTVLQALALLLVWTVGITLICLLCAGGLTHLSSGEKRRSAPSVVVNIQNAGDNDNSSPMSHETAANERAREPERSPYRENSGNELNHRSFVARRHEQQDNQWLVHRGVVERLCDGKMQSDASRNKSLIHISSNNNAYARQIPISNV
uniref:EGF-like domain-containing protein n=1 Tax=Trichuris muris TaxID=70415 RepID=A0A5S6QWD2_TRIMR